MMGIKTDCISGGKIEIVSVKYNGVTYSDEAGSDNLLTGENGLLGSKCYFSWDEFADQQGNLTGDGGVFTCGESVSTYTFTVARGNFHLNARFEAVADEVSSGGSSEVSGGSIVLGENEIDSGSVVLTVNDTALSSEEQTEFENTAVGYMVDSYLDLNLSQVVYKGTVTDYWETDMSTLNSDADISLELSDALNSGCI